MKNKYTYTVGLIDAQSAFPIKQTCIWKERVTYLVSVLTKDSYND